MSYLLRGLFWITDEPKLSTQTPSADGNQILPTAGFKYLT